MARRRSSEGCEMNMTPMIDVVFQLIIFFVVTINMTKKNEDIVLEDGPHGPIVKNMPQQTLEIELDKNGHISIHNVRLQPQQLLEIMKYRVYRVGENFPVLIRADRSVTHVEVKKIMDICTRAGVWKLSFVAIQESKPGSRRR